MTSFAVGLASAVLLAGSLAPALAPSGLVPVPVLGAEPLAECLPPVGLLEAHCGPPAECRDGYVAVAGQGDSCPTAGGWWVRLGDGAHLLTHGPDSPEATGEPDVVPDWLAEQLGIPATGAGARGDVAGADPAHHNPNHGGSGGGGGGSGPAIVCVPPTEYHNLAIYAVAADDTDRYATEAANVAAKVVTSNTKLYNEAQEFGAVRNYRFVCNADGTVRVDRAVLATSRNSDSFSTITTDLRNLGYTDSKAKYWVWYDDGISAGYAGQGSICGDDRAIQSNCNNSGPTFGLTYGYDWHTMMHENGHNLGAVQLTAPHTSGGWHCNDDQDVMCYPDGGSRSGGYQSNVCTDREHWDCNHDDYFHPSPPAGNWLATHWNLGDPMVRFIQAGPATCADTIDNDGDGQTDYPADTGCTSANDPTEQEACRDGLDNDGDGQTDYPADAMCASATDNDESQACNNGLDDDSDGRVDFPADGGCASRLDNDETEQCSDGTDNDGDGQTDYPADAGCASLADTDERATCADGLDNDGDGWTDSGDRGCTSAGDHTETGLCGDGLDNDGDFWRDMEDRGCEDKDDDTENSNSPSETQVFEDDFEPPVDLSIVTTSIDLPPISALALPGPSAWVTEPGSLWHVAPDCVAYWAYYSPYHLSWTGPSCHYNTGARVQGTATSAQPVNLAQKTQATLGFSHRFEIGGAQERLEVQASRDGQAWTTLKSWVSQDADPTTWTKVHVDLDAFTGGPVLLRFRADSGDALDNQHQGWFIDGLTVTAR